jgi:phage/plasmid-associated DNA primase
LVVQRSYAPGNLKAEFTDEPITITREECYNLYFDWCKDHDKNPAAIEYFGKDLRTVLPKINKDKKVSVDGKRVRVFDGIARKRA